MSDFLISLNAEHKADDLLRLLRQPYGPRASKGQSVDLDWGCLAALEERLSGGRNIVREQGAICAWVGDLAIRQCESFIPGLMRRLLYLQTRPENEDTLLAEDEVLSQLNGAFAILFANSLGLCIITDPGGFVPVYVGYDCRRQPVCFGTHSDVVARVSDCDLHVDPVSVAEFLNTGNCTFPHTMHSNVKELAPGCVHVVRLAAGRDPCVESRAYWVPPSELQDGYDERQLAAELQNAIRSAVELRCEGRKVAVLLSGGLDSRLVMAAVPDSVQCVGVTFCDTINREARTAARVAKCYNRPWVPLVREPEFLGRCVEDIVRFVGCEFEWVHAHNLGMADRICQTDSDVLLSGMLFDGLLKGYMAKDMVKIRRLWGLLEPRFEARPTDYADNITDFWRLHLTEECVDAVRDRRQHHYQERMDGNRSSLEWLSIYPVSQDCEAAYWVSDRRVLPLRLVASDRRVLEFAFKCPVKLKMNSRILLDAGVEILGPGARIADANYGYWPGSGRVLRLAQIALRRARDQLTSVIVKLGGTPRVEDSWHDYQAYWEEGSVLADLKQHYANCLDGFDGLVFANEGRDLLFHRDIGWLNGLRLLQLAIWQSVIEEYDVR